MTFTDQKVAFISGIVVRLMVLIAASLVACAGAVYLFHSGRLVADYAVFSPGPSFLRSAHGILKSAMTKDIQGVMQLGVLSLILIPLVRVLVFGLAFILRRDWLYVGITSIVLGSLLISFFLKIS